MKLNKEKFLKSELGGNLQECVTAWDHWLTELRKFNIDTVGRNIRETRKAADWCQAQFEVFQTVMRQFYNIEYHFSRRDIQERLQMFGADVCVKRVALTMNQIETYNPPPNPAKLSDSRCGKYIDEYGDESWELDALEPSVITNLITNEVTAFRDDEIYQAVCDLEKRGKEELKMIERNYDRAVAFLESEV